MTICDRCGLVDRDEGTVDPCFVEIKSNTVGICYSRHFDWCKDCRVHMDELLKAEGRKASLRVGSYLTAEGQGRDECGCPSLKTIMDGKVMGSEK